ncbi:MAG TPA: polysaccharide biosynthesis/export family protein, partial [Candidatus Binataceae bacterium]|nr:polysaccharide biosynthesis/export family protein [Candidatus Binataceae bacterium]
MESRSARRGDARKPRDGLAAALTIASALFAATALAGCAAYTMGGDNPASAKAATAVGSPQTEGETMNPADAAILDQLWRKRSTASLSDEYPIGPNDVLAISVPDVEEMQARKVRVTSRGTIELPLVGEVQAGGLTEDELQEELDRKFSKFMFRPQASVFVEEYHNREVAVVGSVNKPGLVLLEGPSETILDVITQAGGLTSAAADELILIPAERGRTPRGLAPVPADPHAAQPAQMQLASAADTIHALAPNPALTDQNQPSPATGAADVMRSLPPSAHPVSISLKSTSLTGSGRYLNLPVRPGDVIVVPGGGEVMVVGWVHKPGHFGVGSGLTVLGAVGEAGGPMYAADTKEVVLIRSEKGGSKVSVPVNLEKISRGQEPDVPVKANDVIDVPYSGWR